MCLSRPSPRWEEDVTFAPRPRGVRNARRHVSETVVTRRRDPPPVIYVPEPEPRVSTPVIRPVTPPAPSPPSPPRIELVSVEEDYRRSPRTSRVSVSSKGRRRSGGEEVYIERERERVRIPREERREEYETFRYVPGPERIVSEPRRSTSRVVERERVVVNEGDRRREYYRRP